MNKKVIKEIIERKIKNTDSEFLTDCNIPDKKYIEEVSRFINDFDDNDSKSCNLNAYEVQNKTYYDIDFGLIGIFDITKEEFLKIIE